MTKVNCSTCKHKQNPQGGHCYMFKEEPDDCKIHSSINVGTIGHYQVGSQSLGRQVAMLISVIGGNKKMTDTIQLAKECGAVKFEDGQDVIYAIQFNQSELEAFRKRIEDEMKEPQKVSGLLVYKVEDIKTVDDTLSKCRVMEETFRQECADADEVLKMIRLDPEIYRTDCGYLNLPKIKAALAHPEDYPMMPIANIGA